MADTKLEAMLLHLLNTKSPTGKLWVAITVPGIGRFTRADVQERIDRNRECPDVVRTKRWYQFWK